MDTIFALATAPGKSGVAVVRISGPQAFLVAERLTGKPLSGRGMHHHMLRAADGSILDDALVLSFVGPASFTGEDSVELQIHGSLAVVNAVSHELVTMGLCRIAEPGEFTRRSLENGKMDLVQVEGLADLIEAETETQRRQAQKILAGQLGRRVEEWRASLVKAASLIEVTIDFSDEDVPFDVSDEVRELLLSIRSNLNEESKNATRSERVRSGFEAAIVGEPNAGKSTLLNALAGREAAITSQVAGTTRDVIEVRMDLGGLPVTVLDTAGIRNTDDTVEKIGVDRAQHRANLADIRIFLSEHPAELGVAIKEGDVHVLPKGDMRGNEVGSVSGVTGHGVDTLIQRVVAELSTRVPNSGVATRFRHMAAMQEADGFLGSALQQLELGPERYELVAEEIRSAIRCLEILVGRIDVENLLDEIFSSFCLGK